MKKLMVIAAVAMAAFASNAAAFSWSTGSLASKGPIYAPESTSKISGTAYIFSTDVTQQAVMDAFFAGTDLSTMALDTSAVADGKINAKSATPFTYGGEGVSATFTGYIAAITKIDGQDYLFISSNVTKDGAATGTAGISVNAAADSKLAATVFGTADAHTFTSAGWYTESVPEPTSGLLMLLGMAGLALKRKQA